MAYDLTGKTVIITGATSGIGFAATKKFVRSGAFVIGVGRSINRNRKAKEKILQDFPKGQIEYLLADLASQSQVRSLAKEIRMLLKRNQYTHLDCLINNAGGYLEQKSLTEDGIEKTFAVNHLAPFLLTHDLMPLLMQSERGRVLVVSSYSHFTTPLCLSRIANPWPYIGLLAYKRSKLCNVLFTYEFNRKFTGVTAFAVDPGLVNTGIASKGSQGVSHRVWRVRRKKGTTPEVPAQSILFLAGESVLDTSQGYYFKGFAPKTPSLNARRPDLADKLWELSCRLTDA